MPFVTNLINAMPRGTRSVGEAIMSAVNGLHVAELRTLLAAITPTSASAEGAPPLALCVDETAAIDALLAKVGAEAVEHYWGAHRRPRRWGGAEYEAAEISIELMVAPSLHWPQRTCHTRASTCIRRSPPNLQLKSAISSDSCSRVRSCKAAYTPRSRLCQHCSAMVWRRRTPARCHAGHGVNDVMRIQYPRANAYSG